MDADKERGNWIFCASARLALVCVRILEPRPIDFSESSSAASLRPRRFNPLEGNVAGVQECWVDPSGRGS